MIFHTTLSPFLGVALDTVLITSKSVWWPTSTDALSSLFVKSGSGVCEVTFTMLVIKAFDALTVVLMYNTLIPPFSMSPIFHLPVFGSYVPLPLWLT